MEHRHNIENQRGDDSSGSYVHMTIVTFSQFIWATAHSSETTKNIQRHLYACFAVTKLPKTIKTDNGPVDTSRTFQQFLKI